MPPARGGPVRQFTAVGASSLDFASGVAACTGEKSEPTGNPLPHAEPSTNPSSYEILDIPTPVRRHAPPVGSSQLAALLHGGSRNKIDRGGQGEVYTQPWPAVSPI